jgi:uncharacterized protein (TIGR02217 family)
MVAVLDSAVQLLSLPSGSISVMDVAVQVLGNANTPPIKVMDVMGQVSFRADHSPSGERYSNAATPNLEESDMIYSDLIFPECISYGSGGVPTYQTEKVEVESGNEQRNTRREYPRHEYSIQMTNLPADEIAAVMNLWHVCSGDFAGFLFMDPMDHTSHDVEGLYISGSDVAPIDQLVATAVGSRATYPLYKYYKSGAREKRRRILYVKDGTLRIAVDGYELLSYEYSNTTNLLQFTLPFSSRTANLTKTGDVITGQNWSALSVGDLLYIGGWANGAYNYTLGGDPVRVRSVNATDLILEKYNGADYGSDSFGPESITLGSALPPTGAEIRSGYYFYVPVRFENGSAAESEITNGMRESAVATFDSITLREVFE